MFEQLLPLILTLIAIALAWVLLRYLLRLTRRILSCGCMAIFAVGALLLAVRYLATV